MLRRLQPWQALTRQLRLEAQIEYSGHDGAAEAIVTYDMLVGVDEAIIDGKRVKQRGDEMSAAPAVRETIRSARYYHKERKRIRGAIAYAAQGATPQQYLACVEALTAYPNNHSPHPQPLSARGEGSRVSGGERLSGQALIPLMDLTVTGSRLAAFALSALCHD